MMKKAVLFAGVALVGAGVALGGLISEDPGELTVAGQVFIPDHADCDLFEIGYGAQVGYREWFSFPWGVGVNLGISQWQVDGDSDALKYKKLSDYAGDAIVIPFGAALYFNLIDWDNWNLILETGLQYAFVDSNVTVYNGEETAQKNQDVDIGGALLWHVGAEYEYMISENIYLTGSVGFQLDVVNEDTTTGGNTMRDVTFGGGYGRLGAKFLF